MILIESGFYCQPMVSKPRPSKIHHLDLFLASFHSRYIYYSMIKSVVYSYRPSCLCQLDLLMPPLLRRELHRILDVDPITRQVRRVRPIDIEHSICVVRRLAEVGAG
jgi:hypothetical protein